MVMEAAEMVRFLTAFRDRLQKDHNTGTAVDIASTQDMMYHSGCAEKVLDIYSAVMRAFEEYQQNNKFMQEQTKPLMLTMLKDCLDILRLFVKDNNKYKNYLIRDLKLFLGFTRYNVGQSDLLSELFQNNQGADTAAQRRMMQYFFQKVITEGNQTSFLSFFDSFIDSKLNNSGSNILNLVLDSFLPYTLPSDLTDNMKLIYGYINKNTNEHEMYLGDDFASYKEERTNELVAYKSEPFVFHRKLIQIFIKLMQSEIANITRNRLRKYFSLSYLMRLFQEDDGFNKGDAELIFDEDYLASMATYAEMYAAGLALLKPIVAEMAYLVYAKGEKNIYRSVSSSINSITGLMYKEIKRLQSLVGKVTDSNYSEYICHIANLIFKVFETKLNSKFDTTEDESVSLYEFVSTLLDNPGLLIHKFTEEQADLLANIVVFFESDIITQKLEAVKEDLVGSPTPKRDIIAENIVEQDITVFSYKNIWDLADFEMRVVFKSTIQEETDAIAEAINHFDLLFDKELRDKYGLSFKITDFISKIMIYLANSLVSPEKKMVCLDFLIRIIAKSENVETSQNLLDKIGVTKSILALLSEIGMNNDSFVCKILEFLTALLTGGNSNIQKSIYNYFITNSKTTGNLFFHINRYFDLFYKIIQDPDFIRGIKYDIKLECVERIIQILQLMCENHNEDLQNYLRSQHNLRKKFNFLDIVCKLLKLCESNPINKTYRLFRYSLDFIIEMLQGPCKENQHSLVELNIVSNLNTILQWSSNHSDYYRQVTTSVNVTSLTKLAKNKIRKELAKERDIEEDVDLDFSVVINNRKGRFRMSNSKIAAIKYRALVAILALLEMQRDKNLISKLRKEIKYKALKKIIIEVYVEFLDRYNGRYIIETLNHFEPNYLDKLTPEKRKKAKGFIIESGFLAMFIILKLYSAKLGRDEEIRDDLRNLMRIKGQSQKIGLVNQSIVADFKREEEDMLHMLAKPEHEKTKSSTNSDFMSLKTRSIFKPAASFFFFYSSKVEIIREDTVQEIYFIKMPYTVYLDDSDKDKFNLEVDRSTTLNKVKSLFREVNYFTINMRFAYVLKTTNFAVRLLMNYENWYTLVSFVTVVLG